LKDLFALAIRTLSDAMVIDRKRRAISMALLVLFDTRIDGLFRRIEAFLARDLHAPNPRPRAPLRDAPTRPQAEFRPRAIPTWLRDWLPSLGPQPKFPTGFGILPRIFRHQDIKQVIATVEQLLATPEFVERVTRAPTIGRTLRPLCKLLGIQTPPHLQIQRPPAKPTPETAIAPTPETQTSETPNPPNPKPRASDAPRIPFGPGNRFWPPDHKRRQL
jgi:hypothetical protein